MSNSTYKCINKLDLILNFNKITYKKLSINKLNNDDLPLIRHNCKTLLTYNMQNCKPINQISKIHYLAIIFDNKLK